MFLNPFSTNNKRIFCSPQPLIVDVPIKDEEGFITLESRDLNEVVGSERMLSIPTDLEMCQKLGVNLDQVSVSLDPTDKASIERNVESMTSQLSDDVFDDIFMK